MNNNPNCTLYFQKSPNQTISLYKGFTELINDNKIIEGKGVIKLIWHPYPSIHFDFFYQVDDEDYVSLSDYELKLTELPNQERLRVHGTTSTGLSKSPHRRKLSGYIRESLQMGTSDNLYSVVFYITNFYFFNIDNIYDWEKNEEGNFVEVTKEGWDLLSSHGQFVFEYKNWKIILGTFDETYDLVEQLKEKGGYGLTHICKINKLDNNFFSLDEVYEIINAFSYYLSFARGLWVAPMLVSGFNEEGEQILQEWKNSTIQADSWKYGNSWLCNYIDNTEIVHTFPGFMEKWEDEIWSDVIKNCIQWFIESLHYNRADNTSIILCQAGLEKLAWTYLKSNDCISGDGFNRLKFEDKIKLVIKFLNIPILSLDNYPYLQNIAKVKKANGQEKDSLQLLGEVRNSIIHPQIKNKSFELSQEAIYETALIANSYLYYGLLKIIGYPYRLY